MEEQPSPGPGRPTKYKPEYCEEARLYCLLTGATDEELATYFEVAESTIKAWYAEHPQFSASVKAGKAGADMKVVEGFYKRCTGFDYEEVTKEGVALDRAAHEDSEGSFPSDGLSITKVVRKYVPPDAGAALNWLKNRQPGKWRDKVEHHHSGQVDTSSDLSHLTDDQLRERLEALRKQANRHESNP